MEKVKPRTLSGFMELLPAPQVQMECIMQEMCIRDRQCGALITRTRETAIAEGDYDLMADGNLRLSYLTEDTSVVIGDTVETSGRGGVFPKGVMIGTVESVLPESRCV